MAAGGSYRSLAFGSALVLFLGAHPAQAAAVVFEGGRTHTISDAAFENDEIRVRNGSHLIINPGAVLGGQAANPGRIRAFDSSKVTIFGGTFGGSGLGAGGISAVTINDGTCGGSGRESGAINPRGTSSLTIHRGILGASGEGSGLVISRDSSVVTVHTEPSGP